MKGIIYKVVNKTNGKIYIGQCYRTKEYSSEKLLQLRKNKHISEATNYKRNFPFHNALSKYTKEDFKWEVILCSWSKEDLNYYETFYINYYNSLIDNKGYNANTGGAHNKFSNRTRKAQSEAAKKRWEREGDLITRAQLKGKIRSDKYKNYCELKTPRVYTEDFINKTLHSQEARAKAAKSNSKPLELIHNKSSTSLGIFSNAIEIANKFNISVSSVRAVLSTKSKAKNICKGKYTVRYYNEPT